ncbi:riboflavin synthase domain-like protein [Leucogyrophana mollusca]|uniref:Riboflavin synthase domain-like protein n=1 Tax=Leucogyrophana mollusca TaxID=85980 RepID=A0ACB8BIP4_9AGAM|nr:riboflavin synthase domain-like protein [Leucogyrophana mollusca]
MSFAPVHNHDELQDSRTLLVLYATETGTAQETADRIARECRRVHFQCRVTSMDAYPPSELISEHLVIFVVATTGSGAEPRAMTSLWTMLLRSDLPEDLFEDLDFCVFGLGDTSYEKFCWPAKKLSRRMQSLGGREICERGEGDEQHQLGIDGALDPWIDSLQDTLLALHPLPSNLLRISPTIKHPPRISVSYNLHGASSSGPIPLDLDRSYHKATVKCNRRITAEDWFQDVRHLEFVFDNDILYEPGDVAVIHPVAEGPEVDSFLITMGWANIADDLFSIEHTMSDQTFPDHIPRITSLRALFTRYLDFSAVPRRSFFRLLRHFTTDELEREKLDDFVSIEGADELYDYCQRVRRTIREVMTEFRSARIPIEYVFDLFPVLRPRQFSIASSVKCHPREIHLCVAIVRYRTKLKIPRKGVCTSFLASLKSGDTLRIGTRKGFITLPRELATPIICVGPGTGVAPMRAIVEERVGAGSKETVLYFGCRSVSKDEHYAAEWASYAKQGKLTYRVAHSRDGPEGIKRTYVQDLLQQDAKEVWRLLGEMQGWLIISGSSNKMPAAVRAAVEDAVEKFGGKSRGEAVEYVAAMERGGRLIEECWS